VAASEAGRAEFAAGVEFEQAAMSKITPNPRTIRAETLRGRPRDAVTRASGPRIARLNPAPGVRC